MVLGYSDLCFNPFGGEQADVYQNIMVWVHVSVFTYSDYNFLSVYHATW